MKKYTRKNTKRKNKIPILFKNGHIAYAYIKSKTRVHGGGVIDSLVEFSQWVMTPTSIPYRKNTGIYAIRDESSRVKPSNQQWMIYVDDNYTYDWANMLRNTFDSVDILLDRLSSNVNPPVGIDSDKKLQLPK